MDHRYDHLHKVNGQSLHEQFYYDRRNQLTDTYLNGTLASHIIYDNLGNITSKTATGGFEYQSGNSPYRLTAIVPDQNIDPGYKLSQNITYTDFNKVESITGNGYKLEIEYGLENQRISQSLSSVNQYGQTTLLLNKHFIGGLQEKIFYETGAEKTISYITSPEGLAAIQVKSGITSEWYTVFTDHLGSITTLVRESDGNRFELSYDAWGNRRDPATWTNYSGNLPDFITITDSDFITDRGFTGHEQLDMFGLINMNGRVYDPVVSRFLSPDSFIQTPELALNYNGYVYCLNNPLVYIDPSGEIVWFVPIIIGAVIGGTSGYMIGHANGATGWDMAGYIAGGALIGGLSGSAASGVSALGGAAWWAGAAAGAVGGAGFSGLATNWNGEAMMKGAAFGAISGFVGGGIGSAIGGGWGAIAGGASSSGLNTALNGGDLEQIGVSMLIGGALSYGSYELTSYISFKQSSLTINNHQVTYKQFKTMQADYQRSRFWRKEYGGILTKNGNVIRTPSQNRHNLRVDFTRGMVNAANNDGGSAASYHTHWARGGVDFYVNNVDDIVSKANALSLVTTSNGPSPGDMNGVANYFGGNQYLIDRNSFYYFNNATSGNNSAFLFRYFPMYWW